VRTTKQCARASSERNSGSEAVVARWWQRGGGSEAVAARGGGSEKVAARPWQRDSSSETMAARPWQQDGCSETSDDGSEAVAATSVQRDGDTGDEFARGPEENGRYLANFGIALVNVVSCPPAQRAHAQAGGGARGGYKYIETTSEGACSVHERA
jgi:hypothetical protein